MPLAIVNLTSTLHKRHMTWKQTYNETIFTQPTSNNNNNNIVYFIIILLLIYKINIIIIILLLIYKINIIIIILKFLILLLLLYIVLYWRLQFKTFLVKPLTKLLELVWPTRA